MRVVTALILLCILGALALKILTGDDDVAPPSSAPQATERPQLRSPDRATAERSNATPSPASAADDQPIEAPTESTASEPTPPPPADITLTIDVRDVVTRAPIAAFRWRFVRRGDILRGDSDASTANLALPRGSVGDLLIEAESMQPFAQKALKVPAAYEPKAHLDVFLTPTPKGQGITLMVKDLERQAIPHVRVDAFKLTPATADAGWDLGQPLWSRRADAEDGVYVLPPLPPGGYGILLVATDPDGDMSPLSAYRQTFQLSGSNGFLEDVPLEPACALKLDLLDGSSAPFDPKSHGDTSIRLNRAGQVGIERKWTARQDQGGTVSQRDTAPGKGAVWLDQPVAPGSYLLEIIINGAPRVSQSLMLRPEQQTETIYVR